MAFDMYTKKGSVKNKNQKELKEISVGYFKPAGKKFAKKTILLLPQFNNENSTRAVFGNVAGSKCEYDSSTLGYLQMFANLRDVDIYLDEAFVKKLDPQALSTSTVIEGKYIKPCDLNNCTPLKIFSLDKQEK